MVEMDDGILLGLCYIGRWTKVIAYELGCKSLELGYTLLEYGERGYCMRKKGRAWHCLNGLLVRNVMFLML